MTVIYSSSATIFHYILGNDIFTVIKTLQCVVTAAHNVGKGSFEFPLTNVLLQPTDGISCSMNVKHNELFLIN
jgi:hypothetical protein